jgi:hypothetical protein
VWTSLGNQAFNIDDGRALLGSACKRSCAICIPKMLTVDSRVRAPPEINFGMAHFFCSAARRRKTPQWAAAPDF